MKTVILAGWYWTRLWPLSTVELPKQFLKLFDDKSLIQNTVERFLYVDGDKDNLIINTNVDYINYLWKHLVDYGLTKFILEPSKRDTAPAIALIVKYLEQFCDEDEVLMLSPSDHLISPWKDFKKYILQAENVAKKWKIVLFGIRPNKPEIWYWYIRTADVGSWNDVWFLEVEEFKEKPDFLTAQKYLMQGDYYWNSGIIMFSIKTMKDEFRKYCPDIAKIIDLSYEEFLTGFDGLEKTSIDYAIMEKTNNIALIPMNVIRSDVGSWDSVYDSLQKDQQANHTKGNITVNDCSKSLIRSETDKKIVVDGLDDIIVVDCEDGLLVTRRGYGQGVKGLI